MRSKQKAARDRGRGRIERGTEEPSGAGASRTLSQLILYFPASMEAELHPKWNGLGGRGGRADPEKKKKKEEEEEKAQETGIENEENGN